LLAVRIPTRRGDTVICLIIRLRVQRTKRGLVRQGASAGGWPGPIAYATVPSPVSCASRAPVRRPERTPCDHGNRMNKRCAACTAGPA